MAIFLSKTSKEPFQLVSVLKGILLILFGVWLFKSPVEGLKKIFFLFGLLIFLWGAIELYFSLKNKQIKKDIAWLLNGGIADVILGLFLMINPDFIFTVITILVSLWLAIRGILSLRLAYSLHKTSSKSWLWFLILGIVFITLAILLLWHPEVVGFTIAIWASLAFICLGILRITVGVGFRVTNEKS